MAKRTSELEPEFCLYQNDKQHTDAVLKEYHNMLYKLMPLAKKMVSMGEDFK